MIRVVWLGLILAVSGCVVATVVDTAVDVTTTVVGTTVDVGAAAVGGAADLIAGDDEDDATEE